MFPLSAEIAGRLLRSCPLDPRLPWPDASCELELCDDLAYTAGARRGHHDHRLALVVSSRDEIIEALDTIPAGRAALEQSSKGEGPAVGAPESSSSFPVPGGLWPGRGP